MLKLNQNYSRLYFYVLFDNKNKNLKKTIKPLFYGLFEAFFEAFFIV